MDYITTHLGIQLTETEAEELDTEVKNMELKRRKTFLTIRKMKKKVIGLFSLTFWSCIMIQLNFN